MRSLSCSGNGRISLGQPPSTLSSGERQRRKLAVEMASPASTYVIDMGPGAGVNEPASMPPGD